MNITRIDNIGETNSEPLVRAALAPDKDCPCGCDRRDGALFYITISDGQTLLRAELTPIEAANLLDTGHCDFS